MPLPGPAARAVIAGPHRAVPLAGPRGRPAAGPSMAFARRSPAAGPPREGAGRARNRFGRDLLRDQCAGRDAVAGTMPRSVL